MILRSRIKDKTLEPQWIQGIDNESSACAHIKVARAGAGRWVQRTHIGYTPLPP